MKKKIILGMLAFFLTMSPLSIAIAGEGTSGDYAADMGTQLGRGLWNVVSSPAELPCTISNDVSEQGGAGAFTGLGKGLVFMVRRIVVGVSEVVTFFLPAPPVLPNVCSKEKI